MDSEERWKESLGKDLEKSVNSLIRALDDKNNPYISTIIKAIYMQGKKVGKLEAIKLMKDGIIN